MADQANLFGTWYSKFYERWDAGGTRQSCWPAFKAVLGIAWANADEGFRAYMEDVDYTTLTLAQMDGIMHRCYALLAPLLLAYPQPPEDKEPIVL